MSISNGDAWEVLSPPRIQRVAVAAAEAFWTEENMGRAAPMPLPHGIPPTPEQVRLALAGPLAPPVWVAPRPPLDRPLELAAPPRSGTALVERMAAYPFAVTGKLFMRFPNGATYVGSAWVIGRRAVFTAGHCVFDAASGGWATNVLFQPQYADGTAAGKWAFTRPAALREWVRGGDLRFDLACGLVSDPVGDVTGQAGYAANDPSPPGVLTAIGYPAEPSSRFPFDGERMWRSVGEFDPTRDPAAGSTSDRVVGMFNAMTGGCSGGPWFRNGERGPVACGLNSHVRVNPPDEPPRMYSPYFGGAFLRLVKWLKDNGGEPNG